MSTDERFQENVKAILDIMDAKDRRIAEMEQTVSMCRCLVAVKDGRIESLEADLTAAHETIAQLHRNYGIPA